MQAKARRLHVGHELVTMVGMSSEKTIPVGDECRWLSCTQLARQFKLPVESLQKKLEALMKADSKSFMKVANAPAEGKYLFQLSNPGLRQILRDMGAALD
jgi:hypothetical protein